MAAPAKPAAPAAAATSPAVTPPATASSAPAPVESPTPAPVEPPAPAPVESPAPAPVEPDDDTMVSAVVAPGRSIVTNDGLQLAGTTVAIDRAEARKLTALGYLVDPDAPVAKEANGPSFERRGS